MYLFRKDVIDKINFAQSSEIINIDNWKNLETLRNIFNKNNNSNSNKKEGELDLYIGDFGIPDS